MKILFVTATRIGDAVLSTGLLRYLVERYPGAAFTIAAGPLAAPLFAEVPADLCVLEVGLGGRGDATNVIDRPSVCAITSISLDHREMLGPTVEIIAGEKAGIMKPAVPVMSTLLPW